MSTQYEGIYFNQSRVSGDVRMSTDGLGWRATQKVTAGSSTQVSQPFLLPASELLSATWSRGARNYMLQIQTRTGITVSLDGFEAEQFVPLQRSLSSNLDLQLEHREHSLRGWNWGKLEFERSELVMNVALKPDFEVPYNAVASSNVVGKSEVTVELELPAQSERTSTGDEIVELRFFIPGLAGDEDKLGEPINASQAFHDQLQERANIGSVTGSEIAQFTQILFTTPRGRYDIQCFENAFRLHGKTYDYKVPYDTLQRIFVVPRLDEQHSSVVLQLEPPLRQGQTRYPFLVMQFPREDEIEVELNLDDPEVAAKLEGKVEPKYDAPADVVVSSLFQGLSGRKVTSSGSFRSTRNFPAVNCLIKAAESTLYPLDSAVLLVSKAPMYIPYAEIALIKFSRLAMGNRSFDMTLQLRGGGSNGVSEIALTGLPREDQPILEQFFETKNLTTKNDVAEARKARLSNLERAMDMGEESDDDEFDADRESDESASDSDDGSSSGSGAESFDEAEVLDIGDSKIQEKSERKKRRH